LKNKNKSSLQVQEKLNLQQGESEQTAAYKNMHLPS
jgi:hypothetical protein